jgi:hypothetical protein
MNPIAAISEPVRLLANSGESLGGIAGGFAQRSFALHFELGHDIMLRAMRESIEWCRK